MNAFRASGILWLGGALLGIGVAAAGAPSTRRVA